MIELTSVPEALRPQCERHWQLLHESWDDSAQHVWQRCLQQRPELASELLKVLAGSQYAIKQCAAHPQQWVALLQSGELYTPWEKGALRQALLTELDGVDNDDDLAKVLRQFRQRVMVGIIWRDLNRLVDVWATTAELSELADACIQVALDFFYQQLSTSHGLPIGNESQQPQPMLVLGMGKLGAWELNLSSDIDLIFAFPESGNTQSEKRSISNQEFFNRLGQKLIKALDAPTVDGFVFRVDMRLRPYGQSGPLVCNFASLEDYYQTQGRDWERYAMIKARPVAIAGSGGEAASAELRDILRPFTYRRYIDFGAIDAMRTMKELINREVKRKGIREDVKLGYGGIRNIEFIAQAFQLIRGGRDSRYQQRQVKAILPLLSEDDCLPVDVSDRLLQAYQLLRNTEHAIQAWQDKQTQALPIDPLDQLRLAWVMGYNSWHAFKDELDHHRQCVNEEFQHVIADPDAPQTEQADLDEWLTLWETAGESDDVDDALFAQLVQHGFSDGETVLDVLSQLKHSRSVMTMQANSRDRLDDFMPRLLVALTRSDDPLVALTRIVPLVESVARRSAYLVLLLENPQALAQLVTLCSASPWIADLLVKHPALLDELLHTSSLYALPEKAKLRDELRQESLRLAWEDLEGHMEMLRYFRMAHGLRVAASEVTGQLPLMKVSDYLTYIAEVILEHVLELAWQQLTARHGRPQDADGNLCDPNFVIVGYGKVGGIELGHGSDLDLVFLHNAAAQKMTDGDRPIDGQTFYTRLGQKIIHILNTRTPSGQVYEVDMRLRPSGNSGLLVASLAAFEKYQDDEAWTWEKQALVRARVVAGCPLLQQQFEAARERILCQPRELPSLRQDVIDMRLKMRNHLGTAAAEQSQQFQLKQDAGGIVDIEFMVQYAVLAWAHQAPSLLRYTDNIRIIGCLEEAGLLTADQATQMIDAYKAYRSIGHRLALQRQPTILDGSEFTAERATMVSLWQALLEA